MAYTHGARCLQRMSYLPISPSPFSCFIRRLCCSRTVTSTLRSCLHLPCRTFPTSKARVTSAAESDYLADPTHSTGYEPKEFDKITSDDGDTTPTNDPNYDTISDFSKTTRISEFSKTTRVCIGLFGVSTMLEASVSHVSHGESKHSMHRETVARQRERERRKRRFSDQCCSVDVKEKSPEQ